MKTFAINTLGCKVNQYESQQIRQLLECLGLNPVETADKADLVVINTCCVTHIASAKSRQQIRKAKRQSPDAAIVVSGCLPTVQTDEIKNLGKNAHVIRQRTKLAATLCQIVKSKAAEQPQLMQLTSFKGHTRAFLKVQDGCDGYCSYCIIPKARPNVHSKPVEAVLQEARALVKAGHKEIVVTGIFLGAYGQESVMRKKWANGQNDKLADLLDKMSEISGLARIRVSSLEPGDVTTRLLDVFCKHHNIMPHLHLSLQSGSNAVLKRMRRQYSVEEFREKVGLIKSRLDRPAITTDIIVGYPGETDADFEATLKLAKEAGFAKMHIFSFSPRSGTAAASMGSVVNNRVIKSRSQILRDLEAELGYKFRQQFVKERDTVLIGNSNGRPYGRSERYFIVYLAKTGEKPEKGELATVKLVENTNNGVIGQVETG
ncbi:MAG: tRNA (N(6)-L-threonylcarbamoyladenosine(37)-C(2))-methylthiotransferase MtaB [Planctomycetota bacterium]|nr:MAG: tRNA (N(6)-L-threonylcarbamoyladenosine(37)-C(2))-methylthiotransferase MtaB [Planctomycetota bacterium]